MVSTFALHCAGACHPGIWWADVLRFIVIALAFMVMGMAGGAIHTYYQAFRHAPAGRRGLLPKHVALISVSYTMALIGAVTHNIERIGHAPTWHIAYNFVTFLIGLYALWLLFQYERKVVGVKRRVHVSEEIVIETIDTPQEPPWDGVTERRKERRSVTDQRKGREGE